MTPRLLILVPLVALLSTGCAGMGAFLKGFAEGYSRNASKHESTSKEEPVSLYRSPSCPVCDMGAWTTGRTKSVWGRLFWEYRCPAGHRSWLRQ